MDACNLQPGQRVLIGVLWLSLSWGGTVCLAQAKLRPYESGAPLALLPTPPLLTPPRQNPSSAPQTVPSSVTVMPQAADGSPPTNLATPQLVAWLTRLVHDNLPPTYVDDRKWGQQKEIWDGVKIWRENGRLETKRKTKMVNHGTWTQYAITFVEPEKNLRIEFHRLETLPDSRIAFAITIECPLDIFGRLSQYARDVQLYSLSANADAACRLQLEGTVALQMNMLKLPPDIMLRPQVDYAHVDLTYYRVRRVSQVGGDWAKMLGNSLRLVIDNKLEETNEKLVDKLNRALEKQHDRLQFSTQDWLRSKLPLPAAAN